MNITRQKILTFMLGIVAITALAILAIYLSRHSLSDIPIFGKAPSFHAYNQDSIYVSDSIFKEKITILNFFFTHCPSICPIMTKQLVDLMHYYRNYKTKIQFVSITVDPVKDTPTKLKDYKETTYKVDDHRWILLYQPDIAKVKDISENGFLLPAGELPGEHSGKFVLLDTESNIRGYYNHNDEASIRSMKSRIRELSLLK